MKIYRQFKENSGLSEKELITKKEFIKYTEGSGYWKEGGALQVLKDMGTIHTPFSIYTIK